MASSATTAPAAPANRSPAPSSLRLPSSTVSSWSAPEVSGLSGIRLTVQYPFADCQSDCRCR